MEPSTDYFISLIECNRIIYDKNSKDFKNVVKKDEAWARIARNCKISVEEAKKRYASLRQKYCREKQKVEIQRRTKCKPFNSWVFYDRFQFLDEYIRPRTTYTNDSGFEERNGTSSIPEDEDTLMPVAGQNVAKNENLTEIEDVMADGIDDENVASNDNGVSSQGIVRYSPKDVLDSNSIQFIDSTGNVNRVVISDYSGEISTYTGPDIEIDETENVTRNLPSPPRRDYSSNENTSQIQTNADIHTVPSSSSSSQGNSFRRTQENVPRTKRAPVVSSSANAHHGRVPNNTVEPLPAQVTSNSSNDKNMEAMRHKLDSCIASLSAKISEKHERSPHAPFLAYLGTKLPNVPKTELPALEKQILDLVDSFGP